MPLSMLTSPMRPSQRPLGFYEVMATLGVIAGIAAHIWAASEPGSSILHPDRELGIYPTLAWVITFAAAGLALVEKRGRSPVAFSCAAVAIVGTASIFVG